MEYAQHSIRLNTRDDKGVTRRQHLLQVQKQTGKTIRELEGPPFPYLLRDLWVAFVELSDDRDEGTGGPKRISYRDMQAYTSVTGTPLGHREARAIKRLDGIYMKENRSNG